MINYIENHPIDAFAGRRRLHLLYWKIGLFGACSYYHFMNDSNQIINKFKVLSERKVPLIN